MEGEKINWSKIYSLGLKDRSGMVLTKDPQPDAQKIGNTSLEKEGEVTTEVIPFLLKRVSGFNMARKV